MKRICENCESFYSSPLRSPCASCGAEYSNFSPRYIPVDWIKSYMESRVGPYHTAFVQMLKDWEIYCNDTDK